MPKLRLNLLPSFHAPSGGRSDRHRLAVETAMPADNGLVICRPAQWPASSSKSVKMLADVVEGVAHGDDTPCWDTCQAPKSQNLLGQLFVLRPANESSLRSAGTVAVAHMAQLINLLPADSAIGCSKSRKKRLIVFLY
ncbi:hypothetical protein ACNKHX_01170 [Shigella flexneri]